MRAVSRGAKRGAGVLVHLSRREGWRRAALALLFLLFSLFAAQRVLPVHLAPQERPPKVISLPPSNGIHDGRSGYIISVSLKVESCSEPVSGFITVVLPKEYFEAERNSGLQPPPHKALFAAAFNDPEVKVTFVGPNSSRTRPDRSLHSWAWSFADNEHVDADGVVATARFDGWNKHSDQLSVNFTADWLRPRGYGSCWLATPELVGDLETFGVNASDAISHELGARSGADHLATGGGSSGVIVRRFPDGSVEKHRSRQPFAWDYVDFGTPPSLGFVSLETPLGLVPSESIGPAPTPGHPTWSCRDRRGGSLNRIRLLGLGQDGAFRWNDGAGINEYALSESSSRCDSWVALVEPGSQSERDLLLLVIGAALSAGIALLIEVVLPKRRDRRG
jgi:hypothetical protein